MKRRTEEGGAELDPAQFDQTISQRSGENSQSLSVFSCLYLETIALFTLGNEIIMFH